MVGIFDTGIFDTGVFDHAVTSKPGGADYDKPKKKRRYVVEVDGKLIAFANKADALAALNQQDADDTPEVETAKPANTPAPLFSVSLEDVRQLAAEREALQKFQKQLQAMRYEALLRMYEEMRDEQDIEDLLMLI